MPTYVVLSSWTQQGIQNIKESPSRLERAREMIREAGGELKAFYLTIGRYDHVAVVEAPDDATFARVALRLGATGSLRTETLKAFPEDEYREIVGSV